MDIPKARILESNCVKRINRRFKIENYDRKLMLSFVDEYWDNSIDTLQAKEKALKELIQGCYLTSSRLEEYPYDKLSTTLVRSFFIEKLARLYHYNGLSVDLKDSELLEMNDIVLLINQLKSDLELKYSKIHIFDGEGPKLIEKYALFHIDKEYYKNMYELEVPSMQMFDGCFFIDWESYIQYFYTTYYSSIDKKDLLIVTLPAKIDFNDVDATDFKCYIYFNKEVIDVSDGIVQRLKDRMIEHKDTERIEVKVADYIKPYANESLYIKAQAQNIEHIKIGFSSACRTIIDIIYGENFIWGLMDARIIRMEDSPNLNIDELNILVNLKNSLLWQLQRISGLPIICDCDKL